MLVAAVMRVRAAAAIGMLRKRRVSVASSEGVKQHTSAAVKTKLTKNLKK
jgi:hypothetical protein